MTSRSAGDLGKRCVTGFTARHVAPYQHATRIFVGYRGSVDAVFLAVLVYGDACNGGQSRCCLIGNDGALHHVAVGINGQQTSVTAVCEAHCEPQRAAVNHLRTCEGTGVVQARSLGSTLFIPICRLCCRVFAAFGGFDSTVFIVTRRHICHRSGAHCGAYAVLIHALTVVHMVGEDAIIHLFSQLLVAGTHHFAVCCPHLLIALHGIPALQYQLRGLLAEHIIAIETLRPWPIEAICHAVVLKGEVVFTLWEVASEDLRCRCLPRSAHLQAHRLPALQWWTREDKLAVMGLLSGQSVTLRRHDTQKKGILAAARDARKGIRRYLHHLWYSAWSALRIAYYDVFRICRDR